MCKGTNGDAIGAMLFALATTTTVITVAVIAFDVMRVFEIKSKLVNLNNKKSSFYTAPENQGVGRQKAGDEEQGQVQDEDQQVSR